ncbi:MAG: ribbon-helix-helix domain-containing protein [Firmicutes bacterium]|jgi:hypothetical protein|nr:ribbon-helix-helix domain-containing protein [Bacillota bacterium]MDH7495738.1 CopG family transcriptional regulator [Bacillota bacterium]
MKRKQIYLDDESDSLLKKWAAMRGVSEASLVREAVAGYLDELERRGRKSRSDDPLAGLVGMYKGDVPPDAAQDHDRYLYNQDSATTTGRRKGGRRL